MRDKITKAIDALASAAFIEGGVSAEKTQTARDLTEQRKRELVEAISSPCLHQISEPAVNQQLTAAPVAMGEREAFEAWMHEMGYELTRGFGKDNDYDFVETRRMWKAWQARAALAATASVSNESSEIAPSVVAVHMAEVWEQSAADTDHQSTGAGLHFNQGVAEGMRICAKDLRAALAATPATVKQSFTVQLDDTNVADIAQAVDLIDAAPVQLPEPEVPTSAPVLRAMANNYSSGHAWDKLDAQTCLHAANEIDRLRTLLAGVSSPAAQEVPLTVGPVGLDMLIAEIRKLPTVLASEIDGEESDGTPRSWRNRPFVSQTKIDCLLREFFAPPPSEAE